MGALLDKLVEVVTKVRVGLKDIQLGQVGINLNINSRSAGNPALESDIFAHVHSPGRQLGRISDALDVVLKAVRDNPVISGDPVARGAIASFLAMRDEIVFEKAKRDPEQLIEALERMRMKDFAKYRELRRRLRAWAEESEAAEGSSLVSDSDLKRLQKRAV